MIAAAALAALLVTRGADAVHALTPATTDAALARASAAAVRGVVVRVTGRRDPSPGAVYTHVLLDVTRAWGFSAPPSQLTLKLLGGVADGEALVVGGQAQFTPGEEVMAFLDVRPRDLTLSVTGLERGKWTIRPMADRGAAVRLRHDGAAPDVVDPMALETLAALAGSAVRLPQSAVLALDSRAAPPPPLDPTPATGALAARWHEADWDRPVPVDSAFGGHPLFPMGGLTQFLRAAATWSAAGPLQLVAGVGRSPRCFGNDEPTDGRISVSYDDPCGEISDTSPVLAIGGAYYSSADLRAVNGTPFARITKGMVVMDNMRPKFAGMSTGCYEELLTHELGHAIGLGHAAASLAVMAPTLSPDCVHRTESLPLQASDAAALRVPYPPLTDTMGPPSSPGGLTAQVTDGTVLLQWLRAPGAAATAFQVQAGSLPGLADYGALTVNAPWLTTPNVGTGVYYLRVVAMNAHGASLPSSEIVVVVGSGLPGTPSGLVAAGGPGGMVRIFWNPPTGPTPTGYVLFAGYGPGTIAARIPLGAPSLVADHVASGTYYVRVAVVNAVGMGPVTPEIALVVP